MLAAVLHLMVTPLDAINVPKQVARTAATTIITRVVRSQLGIPLEPLEFLFFLAFEIFNFPIFGSTFVFYFFYILFDDIKSPIYYTMKK
jgi:hypothetical protein